MTEYSNLNPTGAGNVRQEQRQARATKVALTRRGQQLGPAVLANDTYWDGLGLQAGYFWLLGPLRERIQALAHKYRKRPSIFSVELGKVLKRRTRQLEQDPSESQNIAWFMEFRRRIDEAYSRTIPQPAKDKSSRSIAKHDFIPEGMSRRQLAALERLLCVLEIVFSGGRPTEIDFKGFIDIFKTLAARPAGRKPSEEFSKALTILQLGKYPKDPYHHICKELDPTYAGASSEARRSKRDRLRSGVARLMKKQGLTKYKR
jgi:hypothetical protein